MDNSDIVPITRKLIANVRLAQMEDKLSSIELIDDPTEVYPPYIDQFNDSSRDDFFFYPTDSNWEETGSFGGEFTIDFDFWEDIGQISLTAENFKLILLEINEEWY